MSGDSEFKKELSETRNSDMEHKSSKLGHFLNRKFFCATHDSQVVRNQMTCGSRVVDHGFDFL